MLVLNDMETSSLPNSPEGLDASQTSLQGVGTNQSTQKEQWRLLEEAKELAFCKWDLKVVVAWMEAAIGESICNHSASIYLLLKM